MIRILIHSADVRTLSGTSKTSGKPYNLRIQTGYAYPVDSQGNPPPFPEKFELMLDDGAKPYEPGDYTLHPSSLYMNRDGKLSLSPRLVPLKPATRSAAA